MIEVSLLDMVLVTIGVLVSMALFSCLCCLCMKCSDQKMKNYIIEMAKKKGVVLDPDKLEANSCPSPHTNENCTIMIPEKSKDLCPYCDKCKIKITDFHQPRCRAK